MLNFVEKYSKIGVEIMVKYFTGGFRMKVFVSWSGELSKKIAESIKKWLPCFINQVEVFFSPEDIEKGENWDSKISKELSECNYGIICLTKENVSAAWINFEAGAIAKALDSRAATLMVNINPSDVKGPLSRYQATKLEKDDFYQLIRNINSQCENPVNDNVLENTFNGLWNTMSTELEAAISKHKTIVINKEKKDTNNNEAIEEMLLLLRKQSALLSTPQHLFPIEYFENISEQFFRHGNDEKLESLCDEILHFLYWLVQRAEMDTEFRRMFLQSEIGEIINIVGHYISRKNRNLFMRYRDVREQFRRIADFPERGIIEGPNE